MAGASLRRAGGLAAAVGLAVIVGTLCLRAAPPTPDTPASATPPAASEIWTAPGLVAPRCVRVDAERNRVFVCGKDGGVHVFDTTGRHVCSWPLPLARDGNPQGIATDADGNLLVADTHASRVLRVTPDGRLLAVYGRRGDGAGEFDWPTGVCEAPDRSLWVTEYGMSFDGNHDRLHHLRADGTPIAVFGGTGKRPGRFYRPSNVAIDASGRIWVADGCNHRLQVFDAGGRVLQVIDAAASAAGPLRNPYDLWFDGAGDVWVAEFGASRVRRLHADGSGATTLVGPGRGPGQVATPWGCALAPGLLLVADTGNQRLQAFSRVPVGALSVARGGAAGPSPGR